MPKPLKPEPKPKPSASCPICGLITDLAVCPIDGNNLSGVKLK